MQGADRAIIAPRRTLFQGCEGRNASPAWGSIGRTKHVSVSIDSARHCPAKEGGTHPGRVLNSDGYIQASVRLRQCLAVGVDRLWLAPAIDEPLRE